MHVYGDASTVVRYSYVVVSADCNMDLIAIAIKGFVHCIVQGLGEEMVHTGAGGIAYEHSRSQPHRCQPFEYLDVFSGVGCCHYTPVFTNIATYVGLVRQLVFRVRLTTYAVNRRHGKKLYQSMKLNLSLNLDLQILN